MNCTIHNLNPIASLCLAPHLCKCQRKLCVECLYEHGVDIQINTISIKASQDIAEEILKKYELNRKSELSNQKKEFIQVLSQAEVMLRDLIKSIQQIYEMIDLEDQSYVNILRSQVQELPYSQLEKFINMVVGNILNDWNVEKNCYLLSLEKTKKLLEQEIRAFNDKCQNHMKESFFKQIFSIKQVIQPAYTNKAELQEVLTLPKIIDELIFSLIIKVLRKEKIRDCLDFLAQDFDQKIYDLYISQFDNNTETVNDKFNHYNLKYNIQLTKNILNNIRQIDYNQQNYSLEEYKKKRKDLIEKISNEEKIIQFFKFLIDLTTIDERFIQCGSNSLSILVEMKVDLRNQCFENVRIQNTSLIGGNFEKCNFNGSNFDNVDISGMSLNGAQLFNCEWKNIKIDDNKPQSLSNSHIVHQVCFSPDGTTLASGSNDKCIRLWDVKTGQQKVELFGHKSGIQSVCFSPDGTTLASGSADKSIHLWDINTEQCKAKLDGHTGIVFQICFSPDGAQLASGSNDKSICLWDVKTGQKQSKLVGHAGPVFSVCFSPDSKTLASGSEDRSIRFWDVRTGQQKAKLDGHDNYVNSVCFSPDGTTLASGGSDNSIRLWNVKTKQQKGKIDGHNNCVYSVCFSPDGTQLASGSDDMSIRLWDVWTGQQKAKSDNHSNGITSVCFSPDGTSLASGSYDNALYIWDVKDGQTNNVTQILFSPDDTIIAYGNNDNSISLWDVKTGQQKAKIYGHNCVYSVRFSTDGTALATNSDDQSILLWDVQTGKYILPSNFRYQNIIAQFQTPIQNNSMFQIAKPTIRCILISKILKFQAQGALILQGKFATQQGEDLRTLFQKGGSWVLENLKGPSLKQN